MENIIENEIGVEKIDSVECSEEKKKRGRQQGWVNTKFYIWEVRLYDSTTKTFKEGKYTSIKDINEKLGLTLNSDFVRRIITRYRADITMKNKQNSFLHRYGHIQIKKIKEEIK